MNTKKHFLLILITLFSALAHPQKTSPDNQDAMSKAVFLQENPWFNNAHFCKITFYINTTSPKNDITSHFLPKVQPYLATNGRYLLNYSKVDDHIQLHILDADGNPTCSPDQKRSHKRICTLNKREIGNPTGTFSFDSNYIIIDEQYKKLFSPTIWHIPTGTFWSLPEMYYLGASFFENNHCVIADLLEQNTIRLRLFDSLLGHLLDETSFPLPGGNHSAFSYSTDDSYPCFHMSCQPSGHINITAPYITRKYVIAHSKIKCAHHTTNNRECPLPLHSTPDFNIDFIVIPSTKMINLYCQGKVINTISYEYDTIRKIIFSQDARFCALVEANTRKNQGDPAPSRVQIWQLNEQRNQFNFQYSIEKENISTCAITPDGQNVYIGIDENKEISILFPCTSIHNVERYRLNARSQEAAYADYLPCRKDVKDLTFSPDARYLIIQLSDNYIHLYQAYHTLSLEQLMALKTFNEYCQQHWDITLTGYLATFDKRENYKDTFREEVDKLLALVPSQIVEEMNKVKTWPMGVENYIAHFGRNDS